MSTAALISVEEYLARSYSPDCDFVDGELIERNLGTQDHSTLQGEIFAWFRDRRRELRLRAFPEQRIRISHRRYRVPDICVYPMPVPDDQVFSQPPYICVEVLSPDDSFRTLRDRLDDYLGMGIPNIWLIDPASRRGYSITRQGYLEVLDGIFRTTDGRVTLPIADLFRPDDL
jgi:Uma2 family endonuclease